LSAPPTSAASEQLFSAAGQTYSDRRSSLLGENVEKLLFLAYNIRLFDFKYRYWSLHAELMLPNDWRIVSDIVGLSVSLWSWVYLEIYYFHAFAISCCYRHLQIIIVITVKFV